MLVERVEKTLQKNIFVIFLLKHVLIISFKFYLSLFIKKHNKPYKLLEY